MIEQWQKLYERLEIIDRANKTADVSEIIAEIEEKLDSPLPESYKEFCSVFGFGEFGNFVSIRQPDIKFSNQRREVVYEQIDLDVDVFFDGIISPELEKIKKLYASMLIFGSIWEWSLVWDLRTYSESDKSYDIYLLTEDSLEAYEVGRNLFGFVVNFCLELEYKDVLPEMFWLELPEPSDTFKYYNMEIFGQKNF